jgi:hypothetical protein
MTTHDVIDRFGIPKLYAVALMRIKSLCIYEELTRTPPTLMPNNLKFVKPGRLSSANFQVRMPTIAEVENSGSNEPVTAIAQTDIHASEEPCASTEDSEVLGRAQITAAATAALERKEEKEEGTAEAEAEADGLALKEHKAAAETPQFRAKDGAEVAIALDRLPAAEQEVARLRAEEDAHFRAEEEATTVIATAAEADRLQARGELAAEEAALLRVEEQDAIAAAAAAVEVSRLQAEDEAAIEETLRRQAEYGIRELVAQELSCSFAVNTAATQTKTTKCVLLKEGETDHQNLHVAPAVKEFTNDGEYSTPARDAGCLGAENCIRSLDSCAVERPRPTAAITGDSSVTEKLPSKRAKRSRGNTPARRPPRWFSNAEVVPVMSKSAATTPNYLQSESIDNDSTIHSSSIGEDSYEGIRLVAEVRSILHAVCRNQR